MADMLKCYNNTIQGQEGLLYELKGKHEIYIIHSDIMGGYSVETLKLLLRLGSCTMSPNKSDTEGKNDCH